MRNLRQGYTPSFSTHQMNDNALCLVQPADMEIATGYDSSVDFPSPVYYKPKSEKGDGFEEVWGNITPPPY